MLLRQEQTRADAAAQTRAEFDAEQPGLCNQHCATDGLDMLSTKTGSHGFLLAAVLAVLAPAAAFADLAVTLTHVHGLSYTADGSQLLIPSHYGLAVFSDGRWSKAPGPAHDYMGFSATRDALHSSGHPAPRSGLTNPFGLIKSNDGGKTWQKLGLEGESDFRRLGVAARRDQGPGRRTQQFRRATKYQEFCI